MKTESPFDLNGYQVVRREFFAHTREPAAIFNSCRFYVNAACLGVFPECDTVQVLVNRDKRLLALMPCPENQRGALPWCLHYKDGKRRPRHVACRLFFAMLCSLMGWDPGLGYRVLGRTIQGNAQKAVLFDLRDAETYHPETKDTPRYPADWKNQFGPDYREHKQFIETSQIDGYTVYSIAGESSISQSLPGSREVLDER